jgi:polyisoprenoid-binding protein YceI
MQEATQRGLAPVRYVLDKTAGRFTVQAFATGLLSGFGHNPTIGIRDYEGEVSFVPSTYERAFVRVTVKLAPLEVLDEMKRDDRQKLERAMFDEVLEVAKFPEALFESNQVNVRKASEGLLQVTTTGNLTFHGVTQSHSFDARVQDMGKMLRISAEFPLKQSDYGIKSVSFAGGALRLKDEVKFRMEMVARQQD